MKRIAFLLGLFLALFIFNTSQATNLYGDVYTARTDDGITIKLLRYHPPGQTANIQAQPVLLFPGILCNMEEFMQHTPAKLKNLYSEENILPSNLANWAKDDTMIKQDPMLYYSLAYYLWKKGYDVWLINYRGTGIGDMKSDVGLWRASLDTWAIYDTKAAILKVYSVTGKHPIIGGHSTGGLVSYVYLQGTEFKKTWLCYFHVPWCKRVVSESGLVKERNGEIEGPQTVLGVVALDPAMIPPLPQSLDKWVNWALLDPPIYVDLRKLIGLLQKNNTVWNYSLMTTEDLNRAIYDAGENYGKYSEFLKDLMMMNPNDLNGDLTDFLIRYVADSFYTQMFAQYGDFGLRHTVREYFENGGRGYLVEPPKPGPGHDGYYYYIKNMYKIRVPFITILSQSDSLVAANEVIKDLMEAKTHNSLDEYYIIDGTAHVDLPFGLKAPSEIFPKIGSWLEKVRKYNIDPHYN